LNSIKLPANQLFNSFICSTIVLILVTTQHNNAQVYFGSSGGVALSGMQDHKFIQFDENNRMIDYYKTRDVDGKPTFMFNMNITYWIPEGPFKNMSFRFDLSDWEYTSNIDQFANKYPPINNIDQERTSYFLSIQKRIPLFTIDSFNSNNMSFIYFGIGGGAVYSEVDHGADVWGFGYQVISGITYPLINGFSFVGELQYLVTPDVDPKPRPGWQVHTSGTKTFLRFEPHHDTSFLTLNFGLKYRLY
jgi:hypothetical protein